MFERLAAKDKTALVSFVMGGDPDIEVTSQLLPTLVDAGVDIIEIGMPFSDPMADGPTIQAAGLRALNSGTKLNDIFAAVAQFRQGNDATPIVLMGYANSIYAHGVDVFIQHCVDAGVDGLIIVDLPPEEAGLLAKKLVVHHIDLIRLIAPTTKGERLVEVLASCSGFIYYVSVTGITGGKTADTDAIKPHLAEISSLSSLPVCVGFGIKTPEDVARFASVADGVVVGSSIVQTIAQSNNPSRDVAAFVSTLAGALA